MNSKRKTTPNDRKPGISRKDCRMPISAPPKPMRSIAKLLSRLFQVANEMGTPAPMMSSRISGRRRCSRKDDSMDCLSGLKNPPGGRVLSILGRAAASYHSDPLARAGQALS
jgi:hypothetical protein